MKTPLERQTLQTALSPVWRALVPLGKGDDRRPARGSSFLLQGPLNGHGQVGGAGGDRDAGSLQRLDYFLSRAAAAADDGAGVTSAPAATSSRDLMNLTPPKSLPLS